MNRKLLPVVMLSALALAGCEMEDDGGTSASTAMRTGSAADEQACLSAVARETGNSVSVMSSEFSQANTIVMVGVGAQRAPWKCLVSGGKVAEVTSMTNEGSM